MRWTFYYYGQQFGSGFDDAGKAHINDMIETAAATGTVAWLTTTAADGDRLELAWTPGVPFFWIGTTS